MKQLTITATLCLLIALTGCQPGSRHSLTQFSGPTMGTQYSIKITDIPAEISQEALQAQIDEALITVNRQMSTYDKQSEISRINQSQSDQTIPVSPALWTVLNEALYINRFSEGAFDITVGPLVNLWGFGPVIHEQDAVPGDDEIEKALTETGMDKIELSSEPPALRKHNPAVYLDLSALAKGYGVDVVAELLENRHIHNYMVEIGGEIRVKGINDKGSPWHIAIEKPSPGERNVFKVITPGSLAVATSGDYRNFFEQDGKRFSHTIDPRTGRPVAHALTSVTVLTETCMRADALATAFMVLGPDKGYQLAEKSGIAAFFIVSQNNRFETRMTSAFQPYIAANEIP